MSTYLNSTSNWYFFHAAEYAEKQFDYDVSFDIKKAIAGREEPLSVLDFGCGAGRDTKTFLDMGYRVTSVDQSKPMLEELIKVNGKNPDNRIVMSTFKDFLDYEKNGNYDIIWCMASLLHLNNENIKIVIRQLYDNFLAVGGKLYASFKNGTAENKYDDGRYYTNMTRKKFQETVMDFEVTKFEDYNSIAADGQRWYNILITK